MTTPYRNEPAKTSLFLVMVTIEDWSYSQTYVDLEKEWSKNCRWYRHMSTNPTSNSEKVRAYLVHSQMSFDEFCTQFNNFLRTKDVKVTIMNVDVLDVAGNTSMVSYVKKEILGT